MGIFYGDTHYGIKNSKKVIIDNHSIKLNDYLYNIKIIYSSLLHPENYQYELYVDLFSTYNSITDSKTWQIITLEQMNNFINSSYQIQYIK